MQALPDAQETDGEQQELIELLSEAILKGKEQVSDDLQKCLAVLIYKGRQIPRLSLALLQQLWSSEHPKLHQAAIVAVRKHYERLVPE